MKRAFQFLAVTAGGTPQPCFGTKTTAAVTASQNQVSIQVSSSVWWRPGDYLLLDPTGSHPELLPVVSVPDGTHVVVSSVLFNHASGIYAQLSIGCSSIFIATKIGNAASVAIGTSASMNTTTGLYCIYYLPAVSGSTPAVYISETVYGLGNVENPSNYWFDGTTGDSILPSLSTI